MSWGKKSECICLNLKKIEKIGIPYKEYFNLNSPACVMLNNQNLHVRVFSKHAPFRAANGLQDRGSRSCTKVRSRRLVNRGATALGRMKVRTDRKSGGIFVCCKPVARGD